MRGNSPTVLRYVRSLYGAGVMGGLSDAQLLERFIASEPGCDRSEAELAFATLMERHGPLVWRVCRSLVHSPQDAEDAFQATFLVLVRKAGSLSVRRTLGPWLYGVAYRIGLSTRSAIARQRAVDRTVAVRVGALVDHGSTVAGQEAVERAAVLHQAIMKLPERSREAVVLCDLEGVSYLEAAARLRVPLGTLQSRLARGRQRLRDRLIRLGADVPTALDVGDSDELLKANGAGWVGPPAVLAHRTVRCSLSFAIESARPGEIISTHIQELMRKGLRSMYSTKPIAMASLLATAMIVGGAFVFERQSSAQLRRDADRPGLEPEVKRTAKTVDRVSRKVKSLVFPPPAELKVAAGHGKVLLYALDEKGLRIRERPNDPNSFCKEMDQDLSWAVVTGVVDNRSIQELFSLFEKSFSPNGEKPKPTGPRIIYRRVELERQHLSQSQTTTRSPAWVPVDFEANSRILDNLTEVEMERTPNEVRLAALLDPLPFLKEGTWSGVDVDKLLSKTRIHKRRGSQDRVLGLEPAESSELMLRTFDFTIEPEQMYRYRARLIFLAPRVGELAGPWSEPTDPVVAR